MKVKPFVLPLFFALGLPFLLRVSAPRFAAAALPPISPPNSSAMFIENVGQFAANARFQVQGGNGTLWLADDALWLTLLAPATDPPADASADLSLNNQFPYNTPGAEPSLGVNIKLSFVGANTTPQLEPFGRRQTSVNYFTGHDPDQWHTDVPVWAGVRYAELYPGLDLEMMGEGGQLRPRLICHQNCSSALQQVRLQIEGAESFRLVDDQLTLTTAIGDFVLPPFGVTVTDGSTPTTLTLTPTLENNTITFLVSAPHRPNFTFPVNPPGLVYSTFLGGNSYDNVGGIIVDELGHAYLAGATFSTNFPTTPGTFDPTHNGGNTDAMIMKINPTGSDLVYATFLGGSNDDGSSAIVLGGTGNAIVAGGTNSLDFPVTAGVFDPTHNGDNDVFVASLNPTGNSLTYATFLGGESEDYGNDLVMDEMGNTYISGETLSANFPVTPGAYDLTINGSMDIFVAKLNVSGSSLDYATFIGGNNFDRGFSLAIDGTGNVYISGATGSINFPTTPGAFDTTFDGLYEDGFVVKLNPTGSNLVYATYLGGTDYDQGSHIVVDEMGYAYVVGFTFSADFPTTPGTFDTTFNGGNNDIFAVKLNPVGSDLIYGTFIGDEGTDWGFGIDIDEAGNAYVAGYTSSIHFPTTPDAFDPTYNGGHDATLTILDPEAQDLIYSTFLGAEASEYGGMIVQDGLDHVYYLGTTESANFPTTPGAFDTTYNGGGWDSFLVKLALAYTPVQAGFSALPTSGIAPLNVAFTNLSTGDFDSCVWDFGDGNSSNNCNDPSYTFTTAGIYTVSLSVSGPGGTNTLTQPNYMTVYESVVANFNGTPTRGTAPLNVIFTNLSTGDFYTCLWDFGDGVTSTECISPVHTYEALGAYTVALTINGPGGTATETKADYIVVEANLLFLPLLRSANE